MYTNPQTLMHANVRASKICHTYSQTLTYSRAQRHTHAYAHAHAHAGTRTHTQARVRTRRHAFTHAMQMGKRSDRQINRWTDV